ncbi:MAG: hypothetical protein ED559_04150 [Phycisphaera sp.]|nr:MAG: hypothetical protein ED559_04150 [Phycisphaera sp.]
MTTLGRATIAGVSLGFFTLLGSLALGFWAVPAWLGIDPFFDNATALWLGVCASALLVIGIVFCLRLTGNLDRTPAVGTTVASTELFGRHLVGIGFAFVLDAIFCTVLITALSLASGRIAASPPTAIGGSLSGDSFNARAVELTIVEQSASSSYGAYNSLFGTNLAESRFTAVLFLTSSMVAILGALFYLANSLWKKMNAQSREQFDPNLFWAGLWFRMGEAVVFNLVLFLFIITINVDAQEDARSLLVWLPLMSLLVGMFLKAGEQMIFGIAQRVFAAFSALVPTSLERTQTLKSKTLDNPNLFSTNGDLTPGAQKLIKALEHVRGVTRVLLDSDRRVIEVEYDEYRITGARIQHEAKIHGF